jgi:beta-phosphoglucomutase
MFKLVIFDLDGVIVNTEEYHFLAWQQLASGHQLKFGRNLNHQIKGLSRCNSLIKILRYNKIDYRTLNLEKLMRQKNKYYLKLVEKLNQKNILPGVKPLLDDLKANRIQMLVASSSKNAKKIIKLLKLNKYFKMVVDGKMVKNHKPAPDVFKFAAIKVKIMAKDCLVIEDSKAGIMAAKKAKMRVLALGNHKNTNADLVVTSLIKVKTSTLNKLFEN